MLPTSAGFEPATSWSPVGRRIQLSHWGRLAIVYKRQNFLKVVVHVIITDKCNALDETQVTIIYSRAILVAVTSEWCWQRAICKTWNETFGTLANSAYPDQTPQNVASDQDVHSLLILQKVKGKMKQSMWRLIRMCTVCLYYRKLRAKWNSLKSKFRTIFPAYTQRQSTH